MNPILPDEDFDKRWTLDEIAQVSEQCVALQALCGNCPEAEK